ncbi:MAG: 30S ribosome-binding factor RbfA [Alphaproteobacteria bacterium]|nr:30S ribosome-binding factor RbfA [Rhodospirillales bacterium]MCW9046124.1 30S ribosome-binding factor RbfA [Alphaproteobacteria bacterium]
MARNTGKPPSQRQLRVGEELRHNLAIVLSRADFNDPALSNLLVTVTEVRVSPDLKNATVFVAPLGGKDPEGAVKALNKAKNFFRGELSRKVKLRHTPKISFQPDETFDEASHIDSLLRDPQVARDLLNEAEEDGA